ncbi:RTA1-domain-containing protein [Schizopora paradoxa]|uniref:RTA1-domain-containing protein n=1 Tax=Schizopora paradoxa TaxID=27342 RepID=A0A0H2RUE8_9AGAM|nr:RTA1-domain-containing protein [Schizopora paradoxa]
MQTGPAGAGLSINATLLLALRKSSVRAAQPGVLIACMKKKEGRVNHECQCDAAVKMSVVRRASFESLAFFKTSLLSLLLSYRLTFMEVLTKLIPAPFTRPPDFNVFEDSNYHYIPTGWVGILYLVLFGITTFTHTVQTFYFRMWWLLPTVVLAGLGELVGWSGRYWSSLNDGTLDKPYIMQVVSTIIAPTPFLAAYFILLGKLITILGPQYSRLTTKRYTRIFLTADIVALVVQALGGGSGDSNDPTQVKIASNIALGGIAFQLCFLLLFIFLAIEYFIRLKYNRPFIRKNTATPAPDTQTMNVTPYTSSGQSSEPFTEKYEQVYLQEKTKKLLYGMAFSLTCLVIRGTYRVFELAYGWNGRINSTQWYFVVFDATMVFFAMLAMNFLHPGFLLNV